MRDLEDVQAYRVGPRRFVVADKALGLQRAQDVVRGPAMEPRGAGDLAGIQRPLRQAATAAALLPPRRRRPPICPECCAPKPQGEQTLSRLARRARGYAPVPPANLLLDRL